MKKLDMKTTEVTEENIVKLEVLFPHCITETKDDNGKVIRGVDFDLLKQEFSNAIVDGPRERYQINWPGKREALISANTPINKTLRPCREESVEFDTTENLYIEGDNLEALKLLQESYLGKIKMIYIDPPYNTGKDFVYKDNFTRTKEEELLESEQIDIEEGRLVTNLESNGRFHSDWLSMMYPRLRLARNLLQDDGVIFISIDDNEISNLKKICDEIFGEDNSVGTICWKKKTNGNNMGEIPPVHDYILAYSKSLTDNLLLGEKIPQAYIDKNYQNPDNDPNGPWTTSDLSANHKGPYFPITNPKTGQEYFPAKGRYWVFNEKEVINRIGNGRIIFGKSGNSAPVQKKYFQERESLRWKIESWWDNHGYNSDGTNEMNDLIGAKFFDHPKPTKLIRNLIDVTMDDGIILDFFSGSGTTAHAVMKSNSNDTRNRKYILVQLPEETEEKSEAYKAGYKTIPEIGKERIRRAGKKIKEENTDKEGIEDLDIGFRVLKIDSSNMKDVYYSPDEVTQSNLFDTVDNIKEGRSAEDLLFQVLLDWGVDLSLPIVREEIQGKTVYFVDEDTLAACFEDDLDEAFVKELASREVMRVVFKDSGFKRDDMKNNVEQIFAQLSPDTEVRGI